MVRRKRHGEFRTKRNSARERGSTEAPAQMGQHGREECRGEGSARNVNGTREGSEWNGTVHGRGVSTEAPAQIGQHGTEECTGEGAARNLKETAQGRFQNGTEQCKEEASARYGKRSGRGSPGNELCLASHFTVLPYPTLYVPMAQKYLIMEGTFSQNGTEKVQGDVVPKPFSCVRKRVLT